MAGFSLVPKEQKFFDLFESSARNVVKAAERLRRLVYEWNNVGESVNEITELEHEGDRITHQIMKQLYGSFVTPFDREDITSLAHTLDDIIDFIQASADSMLLYKVERPSQSAQELADVIVQSASEVAKALPKLRHRAKLKEMVEGCCIEINRLENMGDKIYRSAIAELYNNTSDITQIIKWREIYEHMESATDRCEDVADVLEGIALKHA